MKEKIKSVCVLKQIWTDMFDENCIPANDPDDEYTGLLMLLETALSKTKYISSNHSSSKSTCEKHLAELEWKSQECNRLKAEISRLESTTCHKCSKLERELLHYKKQSLEAENRIKSIANILKLGDNIDDFQGQRKSSAMTLVSQMLFEESPKRKKRRTSPRKINIAETRDGVIPETDVQNYCDTTSPVRSLEKTEIITSPGDENVPSPGCIGVFNILKDQISKSVNLPVTSSVRRSPRSIKKNLSVDFQEQPIFNVSPKKKSNSVKQCHDQLSLNGSLADYVKESNSELDKIWFNNDAFNSKKDKSKITVQLNSSEEVLSETPEQKVSKKSVWKMKESRGPAEISGNKKLRQLRLNLSVKNKAVDLSSLDGYDGGLSSNVNKPNAEIVNGNEKSDGLETDDIGASYSEGFKPPCTSTQKNEEKGNSYARQSNLECDGIDTPYSADFHPPSTSTQKNEEKGKKNKKFPFLKTSRSPNYKYKRDTVRKKEERMKLDGWDCEQCAKYYGAIGLSPSKVKARMNKCSRHRDKFDKLNETPADYWNPIFPDTEECRQKKLYVSIHCPRDNDKDSS